MLGFIWRITSKEAQGEYIMIQFSTCAIAPISQTVHRQRSADGSHRVASSAHSNITQSSRRDLQGMNAMNPSRTTNRTFASLNELAQAPRRVAMTDCSP